MTKIKGVKNWYCSLEMKEKFGTRPLAAASRSIHVLGVQAHANMQTCRHKKDQKSEAKKITQSLVRGPLLLLPVASMSWGCRHMQTCRHADIKKTKKAKQKKLLKAGFEPRNLRTRT